MNNHLLIYLIVLLNALCQILLIWRLRRLQKRRWHFMALAGAVPIVLAVLMRVLIASGMVNSHLAEQSRLEQLFTSAMSALLVAGPWLVTLIAIFVNRNRSGQAVPVAAPDASAGGNSVWG